MAVCAPAPPKTRRAPQRAGTEAASSPPLKKKPRDPRSRPRYFSGAETPQGFTWCPGDGSCDQLVSTMETLNGVVMCPNGHLAYIEDLEREDELTHVRLTRTEQGRIGEELVWGLGSLGPFGTLSEHLSLGDPHCPFDMITDTGIPVEVRSVSTRARNQAFALAARRKARMNQWAELHGCRMQLGVLVVLNFVEGTADVFLRPMRRACYFERPRQAFVTNVPFDSPFARAEESGSADLPF